MDSVLGTNPIQVLVSYTFAVVSVAMGAAAFFFYHEKDRVPVRYRLPLLLATLITGIACLMYYFMRSKYVAGHSFPTELRYIDWIVTTPLMLIEFAVLLDFKDRAGVIWRLFLWDVVMILFGFLAESAGFVTGGFQTRWVCFVIGCGGWLGILVYLYTGIRVQANLADAETRKAIVMLTKFVTAGWLIYPVGFIIRAIDPHAGDLCQLVYNIGDVVNKVGLGIIVYTAAVASMGAAKNESGSMTTNPDSNGTGLPATPSPALSA